MFDDRLLHPIPEACHILGGISRTYIYELIRSGELKLTKFGSRSFITHAELKRIVAARQEATA